LSDRVRKQAIYRGRVQGVGFRATTHAIASGFDVLGHVRNLPNGDVELLAEGSPGELQAFLDAVHERLGGYIDETEVTDVASGEALQSFRIRY
jgi:acylphosphatase